MSESRIHVLYENPAWVSPLAEALTALGAPFELMDVGAGMVDLAGLPPAGIYYSRMSASAHTRGNRYAAEFTASLLHWLESHNRLIVNGTPALRLELSKVAQYVALEAHGIRTPRTVVATGPEQILAAAANFDGAFITKPNRGGKGLGVYRHDSLTALEAFIEAGRHEEPVDGVTLVQEYVASPDGHITRCEFVGGRFLYALRVDASEGFELCPADTCETGDAACPAGAAADAARFQVLSGFTSPLIARYERFLRHAGIAIAGVEFIVDERGQTFTYDVNTNTNYNRAAEAAARLDGAMAVARYLTGELERSETQAAPAIAS